MIKPEKPVKAKKLKKKTIVAPLPMELTQRDLEEIEKTKAEMEIEEKEVICVVHRGPIHGNIYLCHRCKTFYCDRCAKVLKIKGETCWTCQNEIELAISETDRLELLEKKATDLIDEMIRDTPPISEYLDSDKSFDNIPEIKNYVLSMLSVDDLNKIDLLDLSFEDKKELIKEIVNLNEEDRKELLDDMLKSKK